MSNPTNPSSHRTVLVLGGTGRTGRRLVPRLIARGVTARVASRKPGPARVLFDWHRAETHDAALAGVDAIYLVAPELVEDPGDAIGAFLGRARRAGVARVVALSSLGVEFPDDRPDSGRRRAEDRVRRSELAWTILRPTGFAQNFSEGFLLPGIARAGAVITAVGDGAIAYVDADDIAAVAAAALTEDGHAGATYVVTGPEALTSAQAAAIIGAAAGRAIGHRDLSRDEMAAMLRGAGMPDDYAAMLLGDMDAIRAGAGARITDTVATVTGRPATTFADYAARAAAAWR